MNSQSRNWCYIQ